MKVWDMLEIISELNESLEEFDLEADQRFRLEVLGCDCCWCINFPQFELCSDDYIPEHINEKSVLTGLLTHLEEQIKSLNAAKSVVEQKYNDLEENK